MSDLPNDRRLSISTGTIIRFFVLAVLVLALYYLLDVLLVVLAAIVIASAIEPAVVWLRRYGLHRTIAVVLVYIIVASLLGALLIFFMPAVVNEAVGFIGNIPRTISLADLWSPIESIGVNVGSTSSLSSHTISLAEFVNSLQTMIAGTGGGALRMASIIFGGFLSFIMIVVLSFYLAVQEEGVDDFLRVITPVRSYDYIIDLWKRSQRKIGYWLQGQILLGIIVGVLVYLVLMVVGIPYALALAALAAVFEIIPVFGPIISSVPAILIAFADRGVGTGFLLVGLYLIVYQFESQLFYPLVVRKIVGINPIIVILALVIGAKLAGILGAIIAVPLSAALMEYVHDIERHKRAERDTAKT